MGVILTLKRAAQSLPFRERLKSILGSMKEPIYRNRMKAYRKRQSFSGKQPAILIIMNGGIGNAVEATPLVQAVRTLYPKSWITLLVPPGDQFDNWCILDEAVSSSALLANRSFQLTLVTHSCEGTTSLLPDTFEAGRILEVKHFGKQFLKPEREYNLGLARKLGYKGGVPPLYVSIKKPEMDIPQASMRISLVPGGKPFAMWRHKRWPFYTQLADELLHKHPELQLIILGTTGDHFEFPNFGTERIVDLRGKITIAETAWVLRNSTVAVGNDCGPMHIADAVQTKALIIFGATCELKNGPINKAIPVIADVDCRPCQYDDRMLTCKTSRCLTEITVTEMMRRIGNMLSIKPVSETAAKVQGKEVK